MDLILLWYVTRGGERERESEKREGERRKNLEYKGLSVNVSSSEWVWIGVIRVFHFIA